MTASPVYFLAIENVPSPPSCTVHYYTWTWGGAATYSLLPPSPLPNMTTNFVACLVLESSPPSGAVSMGGNKDEPPPPSSLGNLTDLSSFKTKVEDEIKDARCA